MIWLVHSGWMGNGAEAIFVEADTKDSALEKALELFKAASAGKLNRKFDIERMSAEPLQLDKPTECDGWAT